MLKIKYSYQDKEALIFETPSESTTFRVDFDNNTKFLYMDLTTKNAPYENKKKYYEFFKKYLNNSKNVINKIELFNDDVLLFDSQDLGVEHLATYLRENENNADNDVNTIKIYIEFKFKEIEE